MISKLWKQLANRNVVSLWTFGVTFLISTGVVVLYEVPRHGGSPWLWLLANILAHPVMGLVMFSLRALLAKGYRNDNYAATLNLFIISFANFLRAMFYAWITTSWGLGLATTIEFRIYGSVVLGIAFALGAGVALTEREEHRRVVAESLVKHRQLETLYRSAESARKQNEEVLRDKALSVLLPQLERLSKTLAKMKDSPKIKATLIAEIRDVLVSKVRPLTLELNNQDDRLEVFHHTPPVKTNELWPKQVFLRESIRDRFIFLITAPNLFTAFQTTIGGFSGFWALLFWFFSWLLLAALKLLLPEEKKVRTSWALVVTFVLATLALSPYYGYTLFALAHNGDWRAFALSAAGLIPFVAVFLGYASGLRQNRHWAKEALRAFNEEFERQLGIYRQNAWLAKKHWVYLIHGTVQAGLTAGLLQLTRATSITTDLVGQINTVLDDVRGKLTSAGAQAINLKQALDEISQTWTVCDLVFEIDDHVYVLADANPTLAEILNEVCKELVSNANRHGRAKNIRIRISSGDRVVEVYSSNDGDPMREDFEQGLGSNLYENVCLKWELSTNPESGQTSFRATVSA